MMRMLAVTRHALSRKLPCAASLLGMACSLAALVVLTASPVFAAASDSPRIGALRVGFNGAYKLGCWTPVEVEITAGSTPQTAQLQLIVADSDGVPTRVSSEPISLVPNRTTSVRMFVRFGQVEGDLRGKLLVDDTVVAERVWLPGETDEHGFPTALPATDRLIVTVGNPLAIAAALRIKLERIHFAHVAKSEELPSRWFGYEGVDQLLLVTSNAGAFQGFEQNQQLSALRDWVRLGGTLLFTAGRSAPELFAPGKPLAPFAPGEFVDLVDLRQLAAIESYAVASKQIAETNREAMTQVAQFRNLTGPIEASTELGTETLALIARSAHGLGEVTLIAFDLDQKPFSNWGERGLLLAKLLGIPLTRAAGDDDDRFQVITLGYNDLSGQLRSALFEFKDVSFISFFVVAWLIFGYLLLIGPLDYLVVRRWLKRPELTWVTFPLTVALASVAAYYAAYALKGNELRSNQVELVDFDLSTDTVRGTLWSSLFSPHAEPYNLSLATKLPSSETPSEDSQAANANANAAVAEPQKLLAWLGLPGDALGGMNRQNASATLPIQRPYVFSPALDALSEVPIQVWATKSFLARWQTTTPVALEADLSEDVDHLLQGHLVNRLDVALEEGRLFYDRWAYQVPKLTPGASVRLGVDINPITAKTMLTQQRVVALKEIVTAYDTQSKDVPRILELMMFHNLAGGDQYSGGLFNRYQGYVDLSRLVELRRAVFVARVRTPGSTLVRDGQPIEADEEHRWVYYRFVIPVAPRASSQR
jgi:hypothetical protein